MKQPDQIVREARVAGLRNFATPTLEAVERRRWQLLIFAGFSILAMAGAGVILTVEGSPLRTFGFLASNAIRVLFLGFAAGLALYLLDKESRLRRLTRALIDERVLSAALSNRLKELSLLSEVGKAINQTLGLNDVLRMILRAAVDLLEANEGSVMLADDSAEHLEVVISQTSRTDLVEGAKVKMGEGIAGWVARHKEPILISGKARPDFFNSLPDRERSIASAISVPLIREEQLYGVLNINSVSGERNFTEYDLRALGLFAEHAAIAIHNARIYERERQALTRLEEIDKMKTEFIATVSHELRTPLTSMIGCAKTLRRRGADLNEDQRTEFLAMIEGQGARLLQMVDELLSASRIESGHSTLKREKLDVVSIARNVVQSFQVDDAKCPVALDADGQISVYADGMALEQVVSNLVDNACKYSEPGKPVKVQVKESPDSVVIAVEDQGRGIPEGELGSIFERFRQIDASGRGRVGGVGLGLYIVKNLVEEQGGSVNVVSEQGKGSTFSVRLPKRRDEDPHS